MISLVWLSAVAVFLLCNVAAEDAWTLTAPLKMPGELRVANEGLTNDGTHMYLNSKDLIFKCEIDSAGKQLKVVKQEKLIPDRLRSEGYNHVGDIDYNNGVIYAGLEWSSTSPGILASYDATSLQMLNYTVTEQQGMPWVAVSVDGTKLYSTHWNEKTFINVYSSSDFSFLSTIKADLPGEVQGAAFWEKEPRFLYTLSNGPYVHRVDTDTGDVEFVLKDDEYKHHVYEAEGITFMDLDGVGMGSLHIYGNFETIEEKSVHNFRVAV